MSNRFVSMIQKPEVTCKKCKHKFPYERKAVVGGSKGMFDSPPPELTEISVALKCQNCGFESMYTVKLK